MVGGASPAHAMPAPSAVPVHRPAGAAGLTSAEAAARLAAEGENRLAETRAPSVLNLFSRQFDTLMMWVLLGAVGVSLLLRDWVEAAGIAAIVVLNAGVAALQEWKAESALLALRALAAPRTTVVRDGSPRVLPTSEVVRGDLLLLEAGDVVGADARLVEAASLETNEALLTGESLPVSKRVPQREPLAAAGADAPQERAGVVLAGTSVTRGRGRAVVTATGMTTEFGRVAGLLQEAQAGATPLQRRLDRVARRLVFLCGGIVAVIFALGIARGEGLLDMLLAALSLAVAAVPEGLPTVVTLALAVGVQHMARRRALVRHLAAVETIGTAQVIASDKTGTLTTGELRVRSLWMPDESPEVRRRLRRAAAACNLGEVLVMLAAAICGWPVPLLPVHLLWVNFVTDGFPALALATERAHAHVLNRPPRRADADFADPPFLRTLLRAGSLIAAVSLAGFHIGFADGDADAARALGFATLVTSHITWAFAARSRSRTSFALGVFSNVRLLVVLAATLAVQVLLQSGAATASLFGLPPLSWNGWIVALGLGLIPVTILELSKLVSRARSAD